MSSDNSFISENIAAIRERIKRAAREAGRNPGDITLVAASKTRDTREVREAVSAGIDAIGENRVQELVKKYDEGAYAGIPLHFIGRLQKNKASKIAGKVALIHSVDSKELMEIVDRHAKALSVKQDILIEINIGGEPAKGGVSPDSARMLMDEAERFHNISVKGIMSIPPPASDLEIRRYFNKMYKLFVDISQEKRHNVFMEYLSMGMSGDFEAAVSEGANIVRIGSAIFGPRQ